MKYNRISFYHRLVFFVLALLIGGAMVDSQKCNPSGKVKGKKPPKGECNQDNSADCCKEGVYYTTHKCSPLASKHTKAILTINSFEEGGDGGAPAYCDGKSVKAVVADECGSNMGRHGDHSYQPPCPDNIVDVSKAVWKALGIKESDDRWGWMNVTWSDA
ncbi:hypothetical protein GH714_010168 [Hevea brasiliensis]|uniref:RlpA-like protein double-psi beta-barrel domain-containing protein n=1 Tax=Hevea brasiliensis TaxID=3981 RepID=A0A6A6MHM6_HEVBR|nr:hypothetical protein GH714_010168 [Hevea brasiliensis]